jgi:3',5'-cyclic AMP phosphodiesterase CpdA
VQLTFGQDPAREIVVSWVTPTSVSRPAVIIGTPSGGFGRVSEAETRTYADANNGIQTIVQHARIEDLHPGSDYVYRIVSGGQTQVNGAFRTAPEGRVPFRFTSVGDIACGDTAYSKASLNAMAAAASVELFDPVVHLVNGDLSYANSNQLSQPQVWEQYFDNTQLSSASRPWMPTPGNHENEPGNGPQGYLSYQTRFALPRNGSADFEGNWYSFQVGSVLFVMLDNNDVCYLVDTGTYLSTGDNQLLTGYSGGEQLRWLERTLSAASHDHTIDGIVAVMHQPAMSTSDADGSDLGIRENWMPLFYKYGVDFVLAGHDHDYERSYVVSGTDAGTVLRPHVVSPELNHVDSDLGLVHLVNRDRRHQRPRRRVLRRRLRRADRDHQRQRHGNRDRGRTLVSRHRPEHHLPVGSRRFRCGPGAFPWRQDHDDIHLLPDLGLVGHWPVPDTDRVRQLHRDPDPVGRVRLPPSPGQVVRVGCPVSPSSCGTGHAWPSAAHSRGRARPPVARQVARPVARVAVS